MEVNISIDDHNLQKQNKDNLSLTSEQVEQQLASVILRNRNLNHDQNDDQINESLDESVEHVVQEGMQNSFRITSGHQNDTQIRDQVEEGNVQSDLYKNFALLKAKIKELENENYELNRRLERLRIANKGQK